MINPDEENLKVIAIFHYIVGGLAALFACFPLFHVGIGLMIVSSSGPFGHLAPSTNVNDGAQFPAFFGWFFVIIGLIFFLMGQTIAVCIIMAGRCIAQRKKYTFAFVIACLECIFMPFGTILGIFTIITLSRESVKAMFNIPDAVSPAVRE